MKAIHAAAACRREDVVEYLLSHTKKDENLKEEDEWNAQAVWFLRELCVNEEEEEGAGIPLFFFLSKQGAGEHKRSFFL